MTTLTLSREAREVLSKELVQTNGSMHRSRVTQRKPKKWERVGDIYQTDPGADGTSLGAVLTRKIETGEHFIGLSRIGLNGSPFNTLLVPIPKAKQFLQGTLAALEQAAEPAPRTRRRRRSKSKRTSRSRV